MTVAQSGWSVKDLLPIVQIPPMTPDRGGYTVTMREDAGAADVLDRLSALAASDTSARPRVHIGWGSFRNLDLMAVRRSSWGLLCDVNIHQFRVWEAVAAAIVGAVDAGDFIHRVVPLLPHKPRLRQFADSTYDWLRADRAREGSWLHQGHPQRFIHIRELFRDSRIVTACLDMRGGIGSASEGFRDLGRRLAALSCDSGLYLDTVYISNIPWMLAQPTGFFGEDHNLFLAKPSLSAIDQVEKNLNEILPNCHWVVSAIRLASHSTDNNLQWLTEMAKPEHFSLS